MKKKKRMGPTLTRMDAEILIKMSRDNIPVGRRSPERPKSRWSDLIID